MNVGEVAALAGVTVRTLHHYDRITLADVDVGHLGAQHRHALPGEGVGGRDDVVHGRDPRPAAGAAPSGDRA